jgi:hypothetical protein
VLILGFVLIINFIVIARAGDPHWTQRYARFSETRPLASTENGFYKLFEGTIIKDARLEAATLMQAIPQIRLLIQKAGNEQGLSVVIQDADYIGYSTPIHFEGKNISLAALINQLAANGNFYWDFSAGKLTLHARKSP